MGEVELTEHQPAVLSGACPICAGTSFFHRRFDLLGCGECGLVVSRNIWDSAEIERLNKGAFGENYEPIPSFWVRLFERLNNQRTLARIRVASGRLLEVGVGSGSFLAFAKAAGFRVTGCDLSSVLCQRAQRSARVQVHCGDVASLPAGEVFDVVVMNHVLEHVADPIGMLIAVRSRLRRGGILHLAVPNVAAWEAALPGWNSYEPYHLIYFNPETLLSTVNKAGFEILAAKTHESFSGWFLALLRTALLNRDKSAPPTAAGSLRRPRFVEHAYRAALATAGVATYPLRKLQEACGRGDEVIIVARNSNVSA